MEEIEKILRKKRIDSHDVVKDLFSLSLSQFDLKRDIEIKESDKIQDMFYYHAGNVFIHWEKALQYHSKMDDFSSNCYLYFVLLHEIAHASEDEENIGDLNIQNLYRRCFSYVNNSVESNTNVAAFSSLLNVINYRRVHDYFPVEINADMEAYVRIIPVLKEIDKKKYQEYYRKWGKRLFDICNQYPKIDAIIKNLLLLEIPYDDYSLEERMHYGLPFKVEHKKEILYGMERCKIFSIKR